MPLVEFNRNDLDNFLCIARNMTKKFKIMILCEGGDDIDTLGALIDKVGIQISDNVGVSDCGGVSKLEELAPIVAVLARLSRRLEKIVLIVDANTYTIQRRILSLNQSLDSHQVELKNLKEVSGSIYKATCGKLDFLIKIVGKMGMPFKSHEMEDYAVHLLIIRREVENRELNKFHKSSDFIEEYGKKADLIIQESSEIEVMQAYDNVIDLLKAL